jgi:hypothetical protein
MKSNHLLIAVCSSLASACAAGVVPTGLGPDGPSSTSTSTSGSSGSPLGPGGGSAASSSSGGGAGSTAASSSSGLGAAGSSTSASSSSSGGAGGASSVGLPLTVSAVFVPSGYMGDGATVGSVEMLPLKPTDPQDCGGDRSPSALGTCYTVTYEPVASGLGWAGVYWQYPANNWGAMSGLDIPAGATKVSVWAKGAAGGEILTLVAGGIDTSGMAHEDTFKADTTAVLTTSWAQYTIALPATYGPVLGGLAWSTSAPAGGGSVGFSLDSIEWQ